MPMMNSSSTDEVWPKPGSVQLPKGPSAWDIPPAPGDTMPRKAQTDGVDEVSSWFKNFKKPMSNEEITMHKAEATRMATIEHRPLAEVQLYMDTAGVPHRTKGSDYAPGTAKHAGGMLMSAIHGATFGWDDEGIGSLYGLATGAGAQAGRDAYRRQMQEFHNANPGTDLIMQMIGGGGVTGFARKALGIAAPKAAQYLVNLGAAKKLLGGGVLGGAAFAAGDVQGGAGERLGAMPGGALMGGATAGVVGGAAAAVGKIIKPFVRGSHTLQRFAPGHFPSPEHEAMDVVRQDLQRDGAKIHEMIMKADEAHQLGLTPTLVDLAGENTKNRMAAVQAVSGRGMQRIKEGFKERQMGMGDRIVDWITGSNKLGLQNIEQVRNGLLGARRMDGKLLYDDAYQLSAPMTDKLKALFRNEKFRNAWNEARLELRQQPGNLDVGPLSKPFFPDMVGPQYSASVKNVPTINLKTGAVANKLEKVPAQHGAPQEILPTELSIAGLDYTKRYLDRMVRSGMNSDTGWSKGIAHGIGQQLEEALKEIDGLVPQYGLARKTWHSDSRVIDALANGENFLKNSADQVEMHMQGHMSTAETEAYRLGVMNSLKNAIYDVKAKSPDHARIFYGKGMEKRVRAAFGQEADDMLKRVKIESNFGESYAKTLGSRTPVLLGQMAENEAQMGGIIGAAIAQRPGTGVIYAARAAGQRFKIRHNEQLGDALSEAYVKGLDDPNELIGYLLTLQARQPHVSNVPLGVGAALGSQAVANPYVPE